MSDVEIDELRRERDSLRVERDRAVAARDALIKEVLPLSQGPVETERKRRPLSAVIGIVVVGVFAALLLQNWRALRDLAEVREAARSSPAGPAPPAGKPSGPAQPARAVAASPDRWEAFPIPELSLVGRAALAPDGRRLAVAEVAAGGRVALLDPGSGRMLRALQGKAAPVRDLAFTLDGKGLVTGAADGSVRIWEKDGSLRRTLRPRGPAVWAIAVGGDRVAVAGEGPIVEVLPLEGGKPLKLRGGHQGWVRALAWSGELLASGGHDGKVALWDPRSGGHRTIKAHGLWVSALAFSGDGKLLASAGWDGRLLLWDPATGKQVRALTGAHVRTITSLAFDRSGAQLASGALDRLVVVWDVETGKPRWTLEGPRWAVTSVSFAPDRRLLAVSSDGMVRSWPLPIALPQVAAPLPPAGAGEITLRNNTTGERLRLRLLDASKRPLPGVGDRLAAFLRCGADERSGAVDDELIKLLDRIADHFGRGREILVISGYRSEEYNHLRTRQSHGVAKESQHMAGTAIDLRVSGVTITRLRDVVKKWKAGGVGFYPDSQFLHVDVGPVRSWSGE